jgi:hypothetical protein
VSATELRHRVLAALGNKCAKCGWSEWPGALQVMRVEGNDWQSHTGQRREKHYLHVLAHVGSGAWTLVCPNCKAVELARRRAPVPGRPALQDDAAAAEALVARPASDLCAEKSFVWQTDLPAGELISRQLAWLDSHVRQGEAVFVLPESREVYEYPSWERRALAWHGGRLPDEATGYVEQETPCIDG